MHLEKNCICDDSYYLFVGCSAGFYRSHNDPPSQCIKCPLNTVTESIAASGCECLPKFFRAPDEDFSIGCSRMCMFTYRLRHT